MLDPIQEGDNVLVKRMSDELIDQHRKLMETVKTASKLKIDLAACDDKSEQLALKREIEKIEADEEVLRAIFFRDVRKTYDLWVVSFTLREGYAIVEHKCDESAMSSMLDLMKIIRKKLQ